MEEKKQKCICGREFTEEDLEKHYFTCGAFLNYFQRYILDLNQFNELSQEKLFLLKFLFQQNIKQIEKIQKYVPQFQTYGSEITNYSDLPGSSCGSCQKEGGHSCILVELNCGHNMCRDCFFKSAQEIFEEMRCSECNKKIEEQVKESILGKEKYKSLRYKTEETTSSSVDKICRYCENEINNENKSDVSEICNSEECLEKYKFSCKKILKCGHRCFGVENEKECPSCLEEKCTNNYDNQNKEEYCEICKEEFLCCSPIVKLSCGDYFHYHCIKKKLLPNENDPKINFNNINCIKCKEKFDCKYIPDLQNLVEENKKLYNSYYELVKDLVLKRMRFEGIDKDPKLSDKNSIWNGKTVDFAMERLTYYLCNQCCQPYFCGIREVGEDDNTTGEEENFLEGYKKEDMVCSRHVDFLREGKDNKDLIKGVINCDKHGKDFIEYKCKFCCKIAAFFCGGDTHYCEECYSKKLKGEDLNDFNKFQKDKLPICDPDKCEVGGNHPPNGEEFALGCYKCRKFPLLGKKV